MLASQDAAGERNALRYSLASDIVELVVLTSDDSFLLTLREAVGASHRLWHVPTTEKASDLMVAGEVGILVLDTLVLEPESRSGFITEIKRQFPDLVVVVAGTRDAEGGLAGLISAGTVYRFIHKPMSPGRARLFADAAVKKYAQQRHRTGSRSPAASRAPQSLGLWIGGTCAAAAMLIIVIACWLRHGSHPEIAGLPSQSAAASPPQNADPQDQLMVQAENALRAQFARSLAQRRGPSAAARPKAGLAPDAPDDTAVSITRSSPVTPSSPTTQNAASLIDAGELVLVNSVPPAYPEAAEHAAIEGWVDLEFTVAETGEVKDIVVRAAAPADIFDQAALDALSRWRYQPVMIDGKPAARRARVRVRFNLPR